MYDEDDDYGETEQERVRLDEAKMAESLKLIMESSADRVAFAFIPKTRELDDLVNEPREKDADPELAALVRKKALFLVEMADAFLAEFSEA